MKKSLKILSLLTIVIAFTSCKKDSKENVIFGESEWYEPWLGKECTPVIMEQELELNFNDFAKHTLKGVPLKFELRTIDDAPADNIKLYANDEFCDNNIFTIAIEDTILKLGLEFKEGCENEGGHDYIIKHIANSSDIKLDVVEYISFGHNNSIRAKKVIVANPRKVATLSGLTAFIIICIVWFILSRFVIWRSTSFSTIYIDYNDGMGPKRVRMNGKYELVCTNEYKAKDSFGAKIFKGSKQYEYHEFWSHDVIICDGSRNKIRVQGLKEFNLIGENRRKERFEILNDKDDKVIIETT